MTQLRVGGVDGARGQWLLVSHVGRRWTVQLCADFAEVVGVADELGLTTVGVDMPIAMPSGGGRASDIEARRVLGDRRSSLFPTPDVSVLHATDYADALARSRAASGKGLSKQAFHLLPMIRQVRSAVPASAGDRFIEVHPETTFAVLAGGPLPSKKSAGGVGRRLQLLEPRCPTVHDLLAVAPAGCAVDDVLDAVAAALSAARFERGQATSFGSGVDRSGYPLRIVA